MENSPQIIHYQKLEVVFKERREGMELPGRLAVLYKEQILPAFEQILDALDFSGLNIKTDRLELNVGSLKSADWENELVEKTISQFRDELQKMLASFSVDKETAFPMTKGVEVKTFSETQFDLFLNFLISGAMPSYSENYSTGELEKDVLDELRQNSFSEKRLENLLLNNPVALKRFILQSTDDFVIEAMQLMGYFLKDFFHYSFTGINKTHQKIIKNCILFLEKERNSIATQTAAESSAPVVLLKNTLSEFNSQELTDPILRKWLDEFSGEEQKSPEQKESRRDLRDRKSLDDSFDNESNIADIHVDSVMEAVGQNLQIEKPDKLITPDSKREIKNMPAEYYISNAGLVICHPWLISLFKELGYLDELNRWKSKELHQKALLLTQFMVTGSTDIAEFELPLNKILLGYPLFEPVEREWELLTAEKDEVEQLLISVVKHWGKLRNTTVDGLREAFLQRDGKLTHSETGWLLQVEQKSIDILMDYLPWSLQFIKNKTMKEMLRVEW